jgi:hypothetical protein
LLAQAIKTSGALAKTRRSAFLGIGKHTESLLAEPAGTPKKVGGQQSNFKTEIAIP